MTSNTEKSTDIVPEPIIKSTNNEKRRVSKDDESLLDQAEEKPKRSLKSVMNFLYNPQKRTVLGRDGLSWAKLAGFYSLFYCFLGFFFLLLLYIFAVTLKRDHPRYYNTDSTMAVRSPKAVVGMGFRPQPLIDSSLVVISNNPQEQRRIASSLRLFRDAYLIQAEDAEIEECSKKNPASDLPQSTACAFDWFDIVSTQNHPCSDNNMYGFKYQQPCILLKLNKVYGWQPIQGRIADSTWDVPNFFSNRTLINSDVYITCSGTNIADNDVLTNITYYSLGDPSGSSKYGVIPNYFFPYRNAKDHVQPFVLVQFNKLPVDYLVSVTCKAWAPGIEHNTKGMRGMVAFQLYRRADYLSSDEQPQVEQQ